MNIKTATSQELEQRRSLLEHEIESNEEETRMMRREAEGIEGEIGRRNVAAMGTIPSAQKSL